MNRIARWLDSEPDYTEVMSSFPEVNPKREQVRQEVQKVYQQSSFRCVEEIKKFREEGAEHIEKLTLEEVNDRDLVLLLRLTPNLQELTIPVDLVTDDGLLPLVALRKLQKLVLKARPLLLGKKQCGQTKDVHLGRTTLTEAGLQQLKVVLRKVQIEYRVE